MKKYTIIVFILILSSVLIQMGCENNYPSTGPDYPFVSGPTPVITDISPDSSYSGIGIITITGQHFSAEISENRVFVGGQPAKVLSASETELQVQVPTLVGDSLLIQINVKGAYLLGEYGGPASTDVPFKLIDALVGYLSIDATKEISGLAVDPNENIYTILRAPRGIVQITHPDSTGLPQYSTSPTVTGYGMKWGPGGYLYFTRKNTRVYRVLPGGGSYETFAVLDAKLLDLDFDQNGNIFTAGEEGKIFRITSAADTATVANYDPDYNILFTRVYDGYLYSVLEYDLISGGDSTLVQRGIWRNQITDANGTLGANEFMFDWDAYAGEFGPDITGLVVDETGMFYLGNSYENNDDNEAITKLDLTTGMAEPLYSEILNIGVNHLCFGNSNYLYIHRYLREGSDPVVETRELLRLAMPANTAPYFGRQ